MRIRFSNFIRRLLSSKSRSPIFSSPVAKFIVQSDAHFSVEETGIRTDVGRTLVFKNVSSVNISVITGTVPPVCGVDLVRLRPGQISTLRLALV